MASKQNISKISVLLRYVVLVCLHKDLENQIRNRLAMSIFMIPQKTKLNVTSSCYANQTKTILGLILYPDVPYLTG